MASLNPLTFTDAQWTAIAAACKDVDRTAITDFDDIQDLLTNAQHALAWLPETDPLNCPELLDISVWDTSDANNWTFLIRADLSELTLTTEHLAIGPFADGEAAAGEPFIRAVLGEILQHRNQLARRFLLTALDIDLADYAEHLGLSVEDLDELVNEATSQQANDATNEGLTSQVRLLSSMYGNRIARTLIEERSANLAA